MGASNKGVKSPCYLCTAETGRSATCHSTCSRYVQYRSELNKVNEVANAYKECLANFVGFKEDTYAAGVKHANRRHGIGRNTRRR